MSSTTEWWSIGLGIGCVLIGFAILIVCVSLSGVFARVGKTLDVVDRQIEAIAPPVTTTLTHVGGIAGTADTTIARLAVIVAQLEVVAANATRTVGQVATVVNKTVSNLRSPKADDATTGRYK